MLTVIKDAPFEIHRIDRESYHRLGDAGAFEGKRVQLIEGVIVAMNSTLGPHANAVVNLLPQVLRRGKLRPRLPLALSENSEPKPDFAIVAPEDIPSDGDHPARASLVIEIADASRAFDLGLKAKLYAAAKIPEYWVVDLDHAKLVVHLGPKQGRYQKVTRLGKGKVAHSTVPPKVSAAVDAVFG